MRNTKRLIILTGILAIVALSSPSAMSEVYMDYDFADGVTWKIGGFEVYDIYQRGEAVGESRVDYSQLTMLDQPAYRVEWTQSWTDENEETTLVEVDVKMLASNLHALMASRKVVIGEEEWSFEGNYTGHSLEFGSYYPGEAEREEASLTRGGRYHDADILPFLLRNMPFEDGNFLTLSVVDVSMHSFVTPIAKVQGSELVETANTQYDCWVVNVSMGTEGFTAWYSKTDDHYLVKIRYTDREIVLNHHS